MIEIPKSLHWKIMAVSLLISIIIIIIIKQVQATSRLVINKASIIYRLYLL